MRRIVAAFGLALSMLHDLGPRRFVIAFIYWGLQKHPWMLRKITRIHGIRKEQQGICKDPLMIYQMAKVGSTSLTYSLRLAYLQWGLPDVPLYHVHNLTNFDAYERLAREANDQGTERVVGEYRQIRQDFDADDRQWKVITLVRDPIARHISWCFYKIDRYLPGWRRAGLSVEEVMEKFLAVPDYAESWLDMEIKGVLGIDIFANSFPHEAGYCIYSRPPKVTLMLLRLEDLNRVAAAAVEPFLGFKDFKLYSRNSGDDGQYAELYQQFKKRPLPEWYVEKVYSTRIARHFYTAAERQRLADKWTHGGGGCSPAR